MAQGGRNGPCREGISPLIGMDGIAGKTLRRQAGVDRLYLDLVRIIGGKKLNYMVGSG